MPFVTLYYKPSFVKKEEMRAIAERLPEIVARALNVPENPAARLNANDIEVQPEEIDEECTVNRRPLEIIILANDYPERKKNLDKRQEEITKAVREIKNEAWSLDFRRVRGFVWVLLIPGSFGEL